MKKIFVIFLGLILMSKIYSQDSLVSNPIITAVPFLTITPDARAGALGELGVATSPDISSGYSNPAKYAFVKKKFAFQISYVPWLRNIASDINLNYLGGYYRMNDLQTLAFSLNYFSIGEITFTNEMGEKMTVYKPREFSINAYYSMKLSDYLSGAVGLKFIYSNLTGGFSVQGEETHPGIAVAGDLSFFFNKDITDKYNLAAGLSFLNLGSKISYSKTMTSFIPAMLKLGINNTFTFDEYNKLSFGIDAAKLLVPTPPIYDGMGIGPDHILKGYDPNVSVPMGIIQSFYDAPYGVTEEWHEINWSFGAEYWYLEKFALRAGYFYEHPTKGGRIYFTTGLGLKLNVFAIDFSYLIPTRQGMSNRSPLASTMRISLSFRFK